MISRLYTVEFKHGAMRETLLVSADTDDVRTVVSGALESLEDQAPTVTEIVIRRTSWYSRETEIPPTKEPAP